MRTRPLAASAALVLTLLAGCSAGSPDASVSVPGGAPAAASAQPAEVNEVDLHFLGMMIPHHEQAVRMSEIVLGVDGLSPETADLAQRILDGQQEEILTMQGWAAAWDRQDVLDDHSSHVANGMLTADQMVALESAAQTSGASAERLFLELMRSHHEGALLMTQGQVDDGGYTDLSDLAQVMVDVQSAEIVEMDGLLSPA